MVTTLISLPSAAQRKVWNNDVEAVTKADTSMVRISDRYYTKIITVTYTEINERMFDDKLEAVKQQLEQAREQRRQVNDEIDRLIANLNAEREYVKKVKEDMKWLDREERRAVTPDPVDELAERRKAFLVKPPK